MENDRFEQARTALENVKRMEPNYYGINEKLATLYLVLRDKENFLKYNQQCQHPITMEDLQRAQELLKKENKENLLQALKNILNTLQ